MITMHQSDNHRRMGERHHFASDLGPYILRQGNTVVINRACGVRWKVPTLASHLSSVRYGLSVSRIRGSGGVKQCPPFRSTRR